MDLGAGGSTTFPTFILHFMGKLLVPVCNMWWFTRVSMEVSIWLVSWFITYLGDLQPTYIGVIIQLLSTMAAESGGFGGYSLFFP